MKEILLGILIITAFSTFAQKTTVVYTDTSIITTRYFQEQNGITEANELIAKYKEYFKSYYYDTKSIEKEGVFFCGYYVGEWRYYLPDGSLDTIINYDNNKWSVANKDKFPFFDVQQSMIKKGDSIIISKYGLDFFHKHIMWDENRSYVRCGNETKNWTDKLETLPEEYRLTYNIDLGNEHVFDRMIRIELDITGQILEMKGFEKDRLYSSFQLTYELAIEKAKENGLIETDTSRAFGDLRWETNRSDSLDNGFFIYYLTQHYKTEKIDGDGVFYEYFIHNYFNVWIFNPWTGELIENKKMKSVLSWEGGHGQNSGLFDIKE